MPERRLTEWPMAGDRIPTCPNVALGPNHKPSNITAMYSTAIKATNDVGARADRSFLGKWEIRLASRVGMAKQLSCHRGSSPGSTSVGEVRLSVECITWRATLPSTILLCYVLQAGTTTAPRLLTDQAAACRAAAKGIGRGKQCSRIGKGSEYQILPSELPDLGLV